MIREKLLGVLGYTGVNGKWFYVMLCMRGYGWHGKWLLDLWVKYYKGMVICGIHYGIWWLSDKGLYELVV